MSVSCGVESPPYHRSFTRSTRKSHASQPSKEAQREEAREGAWGEGRRARRAGGGGREQPKAVRLCDGEGEEGSLSVREGTKIA